MSLKKFSPPTPKATTKGNNMEMFRHICLDGTIYNLNMLTPLVPEEIPRKCPLKADCGQGWERVDLYNEGERK